MRTISAKLLLLLLLLQFLVLGDSRSLSDVFFLDLFRSIETQTLLLKDCLRLFTSETFICIVHLFIKLENK